MCLDEAGGVAGLGVGLQEKGEEQEEYSRQDLLKERESHWQMLQIYTIMKYIHYQIAHTYLNDHILLTKLNSSLSSSNCEWPVKHHFQGIWRGKCISSCIKHRRCSEEYLQPNEIEWDNTSFSSRVVCSQRHLHNHLFTRQNITAFSTPPNIPN